MRTLLRLPVYQEFFGLRELPFEPSFNLRFLFVTPVFREAIDTLRRGVASRQPITLLVGESGTGKTTAISALLRMLDAGRGRAVFVNNPRLTTDEFIEMVAHGFGLSVESHRSRAAVLAEIGELMKARARNGTLTALVVDEAQALSDEVLDEIRLMASQGADGTPLLPIVLSGQPDLTRRLNRPRLRQLSQQVSLRCGLRPLTYEETVQYMVTRVRIAGGDCSRVFTREAAVAVYQRSGGIPRVINTLCHNAILTAFGAGCRPVTEAMVAEAGHDLDLFRPQESAS